MDPKDQPKTAFATRQGLFEFNVMLFGFGNIWTSDEDYIVRLKIPSVYRVYLDDMIVYGKTFEEMVHNLELNFDKIKTDGLK